MRKDTNIRNAQAMSLCDFVASIENEKHRLWLQQYFFGTSCAAIAQQTGTNAGKVHAVLTAILRNRPPLKEDVFLPIFSKYSFSQDEFCKIMNVNTGIYRYLHAVSKMGEIPYKKAETDLTIDAKFRKAIQKACGQHMAASQKLLEKPKQYSSQNKRIFRKVSARIEKEFDRKFYIGDIQVADDEYQELLAYSRVQARGLTSGGNPYRDVPILAVTLVQIGIRYYDGNYWSYVEKELNVTVKADMQRLLGVSFINTLKNHKKYVISESERVRTILFHTFVSNYYAYGLFELLFQYYSKDLDRDIYRNTREQMQALMDTLDRKRQIGGEYGEDYANQFIAYGSRAYKLRFHTLEAISVQPIHSRTRLRRLLRLIDNAFWKKQVPANPNSRLTILFKRWIKDSPGFKREYELYEKGEIRNRGKKHFSFPYLFSDYRHSEFYLKLPEQIVHKETLQTLFWQIQYCGKTYRIDLDPYPVLSGWKTESEKVQIPDTALFEEIECKLFSADSVIKKFSIPASETRFFDMEGDYASKLFKIPMCAYTKSGSAMQSAALVDKIPLGSLTRWDFEFMEGDVVILPDHTSLMVGESYVDGFIPRGKVLNAYHITEQNEEYPVYSLLPELLLTIPKKKINGTAIVINGVQYSVGQCQYTSFERKDAKGTQAFILPLGQFQECRNDAKNTVVLDIPGSAYAKSYSFAYVMGFKASFDGEPYIFDDRGAVVFPGEIPVWTEQNGVELLHSENGYQFSVEATMGTLKILVGERKLPITLMVPIVLWSRDQKIWNYTAMGEIWHSDFPQEIYFKSPSNKLYMETDFYGGDDDDDDARSVKAESCQKEIMKVDMTRFKTWLTKDQVMHNIYLRLDKTSKVFAQVYVKSFVAFCDVFADFEQEQIVCNVEIIGQSDYFIDIVNRSNGQTIADKWPIKEGRNIFPDALLNGQYEVEIFETETDDSGFDDTICCSIYKEPLTLVNKENIAGSHIELRKAGSVKSTIMTQFSEKYWITNLEKIEKGTYTGKLLVNGEEYHRRVRIHFPNTDELRYFYIDFWDDSENAYVSFLMDLEKRELVEEEDRRLNGKQRYRRYREIYEGEFRCFGILTDTLGNLLPSSEQKQNGSIYDLWNYSS